MQRGGRRFEPGMLHCRPARSSPAGGSDLGAVRHRALALSVVGADAGLVLRPRPRSRRAAFARSPRSGPTARRLRGCSGHLPWCSLLGLLVSDGFALGAAQPLLGVFALPLAQAHACFCHQTGAVGPGAVEVQALAAIARLGFQPLEARALSTRQAAESCRWNLTCDSFLTLCGGRARKEERQTQRAMKSYPLTVPRRLRPSSAVRASTASSCPAAPCAGAPTLA